MRRAKTGRLGRRATKTAVGEIPAHTTFLCERRRKRRVETVTLSAYVLAKEFRDDGGFFGRRPIRSPKEGVESHPISCVITPTS